MKKVMLSKTKKVDDAKKSIAISKGKSTKTIALTDATPALTPRSISAQRLYQLQQQQNGSINVSTPKSPEIYEQRKAMKTAYSELFKVLFKIDDKYVQKRVMDAINGINSNGDDSNRCCECQQNLKIKNIKREYKDSATQTEVIEAAKVEVVNNNDNVCGSLSEESRDTPPILSKTEKIMDNTSNDEKPPLRKKRKRKNCLPRVIKHSHAQHVQKEQQPQLRKRINGTDHTMRLDNMNPNLNSGEESTDNTAIKRQRCDSVTSSTIISDFDSDISLSGLFALVEPSPKQTELTDEVLYSTMAREYVESETFTAGYLPIHDAVSSNEYNRLKRQIYVWKILKKRNLNEILTEDDEDCLQVAINHNSNVHTIEIILEAGFDVNYIYDASNNALHLAILNESDISSVICIAKKIDLSLLLKTNDNGYTPIYLAIRENRYFYAEAILDVMDERLELKPYKRIENHSKLQENEKEQKEFSKFYAQKCEKIQLEIAGKLTKDKSENFKFKQSVLNVNDPKSGNTMLFYAIEQRMEHFIYFLLAHLADPLIENLSGQDAKSFFGENGRCLKLNVKIDKFLENIVAALH